MPCPMWIWVPVSGGQAPGMFGQSGQNLDVHLVVGGIDAGGVVDGVGVDAAASASVGNSAGLGDPQIGAFAHHAAAQLRSVHAH